MIARHTRTLLLTLMLALLQPLTAAQDQQTKNTDSHKMFVKFKEKARLLVCARELGTETLEPNRQQQMSELSSFRSSVGITHLRAVKPDASLEPLPGGIERLFVASLADGTDLTAAIRATRALDQVEYAEPVWVSAGPELSFQVVKPSQDPVESFGFPNDTYFSSQQWDLHNTGQSDGTRYGIVGADLNVVPAWSITTGSGDVLVAFLSTGLPPNLTELTNLKDKGYRVFRGYNFVGDNSDFTDDSGIGSMITGTAVATGNNSYGIAGVDWKCRVLPVKVVDANNRSSSDWFASGLIYAADQGANVICLGWGGSLNSPAFNDAVTYAASKGAILVTGVATGYGYFNTYPPSYDKVILVGSTDNQDKRLNSTYGRVDFMAPGDKNLGLWRMENVYGSLSGPLGAAPLVAGVVSLMLSLRSSLTFDEVYDILKESAADQVGWPNEDTPGWDQYYGWGRIDAYRALRLVLERYPDRSQPNRYGVSQNYPNPFNGRTTIEYEIPDDAKVSIRVYNILGQPVTTLVDEVQGRGYHHAYWHWSGPSGVYFYRLQTGSLDRIYKMIVTK